ncbi:hypothetical protein KH5H1_58560 [Corallococcus caeni]|uniref:Secreted protein n=1 Tax=Corallococcus caeni TaxID=3082388 RepID=A0ABQ6QQ95_9BACT|nr:hypothetical protein KH5H1_58560 [Corallococcus sp. KH5-1]GMU06182.1 hypothetical protein ASNO1_24350 [Corallococcus sp. NO1]
MIQSDACPRRTLMLLASSGMPQCAPAGAAHSDRSSGSLQDRRTDVFFTVWLRRGEETTSGRAPDPLRCTAARVGGSAQLGAVRYSKSSSVIR